MQPQIKALDILIHYQDAELEQHIFQEPVTLRRNVNICSLENKTSKTCRCGRVTDLVL